MTNSIVLAFLVSMYKRQKSTVFNILLVPTTGSIKSLPLQNW